MNITASMDRPDSRDRFDKVFEFILVAS